MVGMCLMMACLVGIPNRSVSSLYQPPTADDADNKDSSDSSTDTHDGKDPADARRDNELDGDNSEDDSEIPPNNLPADLRHLHWEGLVDTTVGLESKVDKAGFAALRSPEFPFEGLDLQGGYDALEITCRTDARVYTVNLVVNSFLPNEDMYQGHIMGSQPRKAETLSISQSNAAGKRCTCHSASLDLGNGG